MSLFQFSQEEVLTFFAVLVRYSVLFSVLPFIGDKMVYGPLKVVFALVVSIAMFPALITHHYVNPKDALIWGSQASSIAGTIGLEVLFALALGFTARLLFDAIGFGSNLVGNFMGFASANIYDPHQETHTQVVGEFQMSLAMLIFLALDGHHLLLKASLDSYRIVPMGSAGFTAIFTQRLTEMTANVVKFAVQLAAPVGLAIFSVNVAFGVISRAMPQVNVLVLSFAVTSLVGLVVMLIGLPEFYSGVAGVFSRFEDWLLAIQYAWVGK